MAWKNIILDRSGKPLDGDARKAHLEQQKLRRLQIESDQFRAFFDFPQLPVNNEFDLTDLVVKALVIKTEWGNAIDYNSGYLKRNSRIKKHQLSIIKQFKNDLQRDHGFLNSALLYEISTFLWNSDLSSLPFEYPGEFKNDEDSERFQNTSHIFEDNPFNPMIHQRGLKHALRLGAMSKRTFDKAISELESWEQERKVDAAEDIAAYSIVNPVKKTTKRTRLHLIDKCPEQYAVFLYRVFNLLRFGVIDFNNDDIVFVAMCFLPPSFLHKVAPDSLRKSLPCTAKKKEVAVSFSKNYRITLEHISRDANNLFKNDPVIQALSSHLKK